MLILWDNTLCLLWWLREYASTSCQQVLAMPGWVEKKKKKEVHTDAYGRGRCVALKFIIAYGCLRRAWVGGWEYFN